MKKIEIEKIKEALKKDFYILYQKGFTMDWKEQRLLRSIEIDIMGLDNIEHLLNKEG